MDKLKLQETINKILQMAADPVSFDDAAKNVLSWIFELPWISIQPKGALFLTEKTKLQKRSLKCVAEFGLDKKSDCHCERIEEGEGYCEQAANLKEVFWINNDQKKCSLSQENSGAHPNAVFPIAMGGKLQGVLHLFPIHPAAPEAEKEKEDIMSILQSIGSVIERKSIDAMLYEAYHEVVAKTAKLEKANIEIKETTSQLIQTEKLAALGELTAGVAHELNQPLNGIKIICQSLLRDIEKNQLDESYLQEDMENVVSQVDRMATIIDHMRVFTRNSVGSDSSSVDPNEVVKGPFILIKSQLGKKGIKVEFDLDERISPVYSNQIQLEQVIFNLVSNAKLALFDCDKSNKTITVKTYSLSAQDSPLECPSSVMVVKDNAGGISPENLNKILQPFFTTREPGKGTGLGLSISHKIVTKYKGQLDIESELEKGTSVIITLPSMTEE